MGCIYRIRRGAVLGCLVAAALLSSYGVDGPPARAATPPTAPATRTIAISYFDNNTGDASLDPLQKGLADMLITDLSKVSSLRIVERARLEELLGELKLGKSRFIDKKTAQRLGKGLAAQWIMTGSYVLSGETFRIDLRIIRVETAEIVLSEKVEGPRDDFFIMEKELVELLVTSLELKLPSQEKRALRRNQTQSFEAWQRYSEGLAAQDSGDNAKARTLFQAALAKDPNYRAAKDARGRIESIFASADQARDAKQDAMLASLDPKAPGFGQKINDLLATFDDSDAVQLGRKVALLTWLAKRDLAPVGMGGFSRVPLEISGLVNRHLSDPDMAGDIPAICEYLITRWPQDRMAQPMCKTWLKVLDATAKVPYDGRKASWTSGREGTNHLDWELALIKNEAAIYKLLRMYARLSR